MADDNSKTGDVWGFLTLVDGKGDPALTGKVPLKACKISIGRAKGKCMSQGEPLVTVFLIGWFEFFSFP